jgi:hypothetical protein
MLSFLDIILPFPSVCCEAITKIFSTQFGKLLGFKIKIWINHIKIFKKLTCQRYS